MIKLTNGDRVEINNLPIVLLQAGLWAGDGPPPELIPEARIGEHYLDRLTGDLYELRPGG